MTCSKSVAFSPPLSCRFENSLPAKSTRESLLQIFSSVIKLLLYICMVMILQIAKQKIFFRQNSEISHSQNYKDDKLTECLSILPCPVQGSDGSFPMGEVSIGKGYLPSFVLLVILVGLGREAKRCMQVKFLNIMTLGYLSLTPGSNANASRIFRIQTICSFGVRKECPFPILYMVCAVLGGQIN